MSAMCRWLRWEPWQSEVTALYGLRQSKLATAKPAAAASAASGPTPASLAVTDDISQQQVKLSVDQFYALRAEAMSGRVARALQSGLSPSFAGRLDRVGRRTLALAAGRPHRLQLRPAPGSDQRRRRFPFRIDIDAPTGSPVRAAADGNVTEAAMNAGYGREIIIDHGHDVMTIYGHLSVHGSCSWSACDARPGYRLCGQTGRATGPHLHYEVRVRKVPVNPYKISAHHL